jgi:hypothetical protein
MWYTATRRNGWIFIHRKIAPLPPPGNDELEHKGRLVRLLTEIFGGMTGLTEEIGTTEDARYASTGAFARARFGLSMKTEP